MSHSRPFEHHVFISYAHIDNLPLAAGENSRVANFHHALDVRLRQLPGGEARRASPAFTTRAGGWPITGNI